MSDQFQDLQQAKDDAIPTFRIVRKEQPVRIGDELYTLRELSGPLRVEYQDLLNKNAKVSADGKSVTWTTTRYLSEGLLVRGLYKGSVSEGKLVTVADMAEWPASTMEGLADMLRKLSALDVKAEEEAKND